jgi:hypothetical protein
MHSENAYAQMSDSIQLKNGQTLIGTFKGWQNNEINFFIYDAGIISINYAKVNMLYANSAKYHIETFAGNVFYDTLICEKPGEFIFTNNGNRVIISFKEIEFITSLKKGVIPSGFIGIGYNYSKSNDFGLLAADGGLSIKSEDWIVEGAANTNFIHSKANGLERNRKSGNLNVDRVINARWQSGIRYIYQRNKELGLAYRHLAGGGLLYKIIRKPNFHLNISSGIAASAESTFDDQKYNRFEIPFLLELTVSKLGSTNLSLNHTQLFFISVGNNRRIRHDGELRLNMQLFKKLSFTTYIFNNYDSAPVQKVGTNNLDYGWNTGLKLGF